MMTSATTLDSRTGRLLAEGWTAYVERMFAVTIGEVRHRETRRAFYAGAATMLAVCADIADEHLDDESGGAVLSACSDELIAFMTAVSEEQA